MCQVALVDHFTEFLALPGNLHFAETNLALKGLSRQPAQILLILLLAARPACAQGGHPTPPPPPPGAKSVKCTGRPIPQLEDITAKTGITFKHTSDPAKRYIVESMSRGVVLFDYDRDGWLDIYFTNAPSVEMAIKCQKARGALYHNNRDGTFTDVTAKSGLTSSCFAMGRAVGDLFNDGNVDVVIGDIDGAPMILKNHGVPGRHWISFELAGTKSNRLAIGARVKVIAGGMTQTDEIHSGGSYLSQNDLRLHFGLGAATKVERVEIRWLSGKMDTLTGLSADQFHYILEGSGVVPAGRIRPNPPAKAGPSAQIVPASSPSARQK